MTTETEKAVMENQTPVKEKIIIGGRKERISTQDILDAIRKYKTESPSELAEKLECNRRTVYRKIQEIPREQIDAIFKDLSESELKPSEMEWEVFKTLPEMEEYRKMLERNQVAPLGIESLLAGIHHVCKNLKIRPRSLTIDKLDVLADLVLKARKKEMKEIGLRSESNLRSIIRRWYIYHGISGQLLTTKGIGGEMGKGYGKSATDKLTKEQRASFIQALKETVIAEGYGNDLTTWECLPYWLFYTGTRIEASVTLDIEKIKWSGNLKDPNTIGRAYVIDKGKHRKGRTPWTKLIMGELKDKIIANLESRGMPQQGLLFNGLDTDKVRTIFRKAYEKANIKVHQPAHVWRHTGAQELLDATNWNYDLVGAILGWKDTKTLKECYGAMGESIRERALRKALGMPIEEQLKEFKF